MLSSTYTCIMKSSMYVELHETVYFMLILVTNNKNKTFIEIQKIL